MKKMVLFVPSILMFINLRGMNPYSHKNPEKQSPNHQVTPPLKRSCDMHKSSGGSPGIPILDSPCGRNAKIQVVLSTQVPERRKKDFYS